MNNRRAKIGLGGGGEHKRNFKATSIAKALAGKQNSNVKIFEQISSLENLFLAWQEFKKGKSQKIDVQEFSLHLEDNIFTLHEDLRSGSYQHSQYSAFCVTDPKLRHIHKACVRDRLLHHAIHRVIEPLFDKSFVFDSYASRTGKGTHKAILRFQKFAWQLSQNNTRTVWVLKCDISKYFASVDHRILYDLLGKKITDEYLLRLFADIIESFADRDGVGIPLGNLTSQLFANVYLNELDKFVKRQLRVKYYIRYADDFVLLSRHESELSAWLYEIDSFLKNILQLELHPHKCAINKWHQGVDVLGVTSFPNHRQIRTKTKWRMLKNITRNKEMLEAGEISRNKFEAVVCSYLGMVKHGNNRKIIDRLINFQLY